MSDYTEGCCFNYFRDNCPGRGCTCKCHEEEAERLRQRSRDEDTARIRLNEARIKAEAERDAAVAQGRGDVVATLLPLAQECVAAFEGQKQWLGTRHPQAAALASQEDRAHLQGALRVADTGLRQGVDQLNKVLAGVAGKDAVRLRGRLAPLSKPLSRAVAPSAPAAPSARSAPSASPTVPLEKEPAPGTQ